MKDLRKKKRKYRCTSMFISKIKVDNVRKLWCKIEKKDTEMKN